MVRGQRSQLWWDIPALDSFRLLKEIYGVDAQTFDLRVHEQAERLGVVDRLHVQLRQLSLGERMKMEIIGAFLHNPEVVFLDEPTIGLDLVSQETIRRFLRAINRARGATIVLTSHDMADIEETCDRLVILDAGAVLELWLAGSDAARFFFELFNAAYDRPLDIFSARVRLFLLYIVPIGALTQIPAELLLGRYTLLEAMQVSVWLLLLGLLVFAAWDRSLRRYQSALG